MELRRKNDTIMVEIQADLKVMKKGQEVLQQSLVEHIKTETNARSEIVELVKRHDSILMGDSVQCGIYKSTKENSKFIEHMRDLRIVETAMEGRVIMDRMKAFAWLLGFVGVSSLAELLYQLSPIFSFLLQKVGAGK